MATPPSAPPPSIDALDAALRRVTEYLALQVTRPSTEPPNWSETEWRISMAVMALQGTAALLVPALKWRGPDRWQAHLQKQKTHSLLRYEFVANLLSQLDSVARDENVPMVALKGAALYRANVYSPGERVLGDIDLLVKPEDFTAATKAILACGYRQAFENPRHRVFEIVSAKKPVTFDEDIDNPIKIELHRHIAEALPLQEVDITASLFPRDLQPGLNDYASRAALMRHLLLHAANNIRARALRQTQLHDIALVAAHMNESDWDELLRSNDRRGAWWALSPLALTARYYDESIPATTIAAARQRCPAWLRRVTERQQLTDVSWSNIRIEAFPGIEWSKSPLEAIAFARTRIAPKKHDLEPLAYMMETQPWTTEVPWYRRSHVERIMRWIFLSPPRVQTMYSVQSALSLNF